jgi:hypothetical protein
MENLRQKMFLLAVFVLTFVGHALCETRSSQDMAKECRVALDLFGGRALKSALRTHSLLANA